MNRDQILVFCYHKSGTVLFGSVMQRIATRLGLTMQSRFGFVPFIDPTADIVLLGHALLGALPARRFRAVRIIRDPRDIWVSGYLYHRRCREIWCINTHLNPASPINFPQVPMAFAHRRERWKRDYLRRLGGMSYQQNLLMRDREAGLAFELAGYTAGTLEDMSAWPWRDAGIADIMLEHIAADFDGTFSTVLAHLGFAADELPDLLRLAATEDINRMDDSAIAGHTHIHGRRLSKWAEMLDAAQVAGFERTHGGLIARLGYAPAAP